MSRSVVVSNISTLLSENNLRVVFSECGTILNMRIVGDSDCRICRIDYQLTGMYSIYYIIIYFSTIIYYLYIYIEHALAACALSGIELGDRALRVILTDASAPLTTTLSSQGGALYGETIANLGLSQELTTLLTTGITTFPTKSIENLLTEVRRLAEVPDALNNNTLLSQILVKLSTDPNGLVLGQVCI